MLKKIIWLLTTIAILSFVSCGGGSSSKEAKELMQKMLNFVGIPTNIIVAVCIDKDKNGICASTEVQAKITLNQGDNFDDVWAKLALNDEGKYLLEVYDEKLPILIQIQDEAKVDFDDGKFTLTFDGFKTKENKEEKEISILQSMVDSNAISNNEADTFRTLINKDAQNKFYITLLNDLETNLNTLRVKGLETQEAISATIKEMGDETKANQAKANRINVCGDNQTCVDREIKSLSDELIITDAESNEIVELKFTQEYILGKTLYMVRDEDNGYFTVKYGADFGTREIGIEGNMTSQEYIINEKGEINVNDNNVIIKLIAHYETYDHIQVSLPKINKIYKNQRAYFKEEDAKAYFLSINDNDKESEEVKAKFFRPSKTVCESNGGDKSSFLCRASWENAKRICSASGGVLPTLKNLTQVITDCGGVVGDTQSNQDNVEYQTCYKQEYFFPSPFYWSSTTHLEDNTFAWRVDFSFGYESDSEKDKTAVVGCMNL